MNNCAAPCKTCPFRTANFGRPNPPGYSPEEFAKHDPGSEFHDWFSLKNLTRLWRDGVSKGEVLICHATDPDAARYGGVTAKPGSERPCVGAIILVHLRDLELEHVALRHQPVAEVDALDPQRAAVGRDEVLALDADEGIGTR